MKTYSMTFGQSIDHKPEHPERTARRCASPSAMNGDVVFGVWPNRPSMLKTIEMQEQRERHWRDWRPLHKRQLGGEPKIFS